MGKATTKEMIEFCQWAAAQKDASECINWPFHKVPSGYGRATYRGRRTSAHRVVLEIATGITENEGLQAAHAPIICHNPACVNPNHLRWATPLENSQDKFLDKTAKVTNGSHDPTHCCITFIRNKYRAYGYVYRQSKNRQIHLGTFASFDEAVAARRKFLLARSKIDLTA